MRDHHSKSIKMTSRNCQGCLPLLPSGNFCMHTTLKGIHSHRVDGNLIGRYVPKQKKQVKQKVRSGKARENSEQVQKDKDGKKVNLGAFMKGVQRGLVTLFLK